MILKSRFYFIIIFILLFSSVIGYAQENSTAEKLSVETKDKNEDGNPDIWLYYNENKDHVKSVADRDYDGAPDYWRYLIDGIVDREEGDIDFDGNIDVWMYYSEGKKTKAAKDTNKDTVPDMFIYYKAGKIVGVEKDTDFDGKIDETIGTIPKSNDPQERVN